MENLPLFTAGFIHVRWLAGFLNRQQYSDACLRLSLKMTYCCSGRASTVEAPTIEVNDIDLSCIYIYIIYIYNFAQKVS